MVDDLVLLGIDRDVGIVQEVVGEILLDHIALVAEADHEVVDAVVAVGLHDVPEDRPPADFDHRLGAQMRFLGDARAHAAGKNDGFQGLIR